MRLACVTSLLAVLSAVEAHSTLQRRQTYPPSADFIIDDPPSEQPAVPDAITDFFKDAPPSKDEAANMDLPIDEEDGPVTDMDGDTPTLRSGTSDVSPATDDSPDSPAMDDSPDSPAMDDSPDFPETDDPLDSPVADDSPDSPAMNDSGEESLVMEEFFRQGPAGGSGSAAAPTPPKAATIPAASPSTTSGMAPSSPPKPNVAPVSAAQAPAQPSPNTPASPTSESPCFSELFVYGDSLSETGNVFKLTGKRFPPSPPYHNGRLSNGPIWSEFVAGTLKTPLTTWAYAGATVDNTLVESNVVGVNIPVPSVYDQVLLSLINHPPAESPDRLYAIWVGGNDFVNTQFKPNTSALLDRMEMIVSTLAMNGARHVVVFGLPPVGDTPLGASLGGAPISAITNKFSDDLKASIESIKGEITAINPDFKFYFVDMVAIFKDLVGNPQYGFTNPAMPCLGQDGTICKDPDTYIFFDVLHPTTRFHKFLAKRVMKDVLGISDLPAYNKKCVGATKAKVCLNASAGMVLKKKNELKKCVNTCVA